MTFINEQITLSATQDELWQFISTPTNLNVITPDFLDFKIISHVPEQMYNGLLIEYRVKIPLIGYQTWLTEIKHIEKGVRFVDEQRIGPYQLWYHEHGLQRIGNTRTTMTDKIAYRLPFEPLSYPAKVLFTKPFLAKIFTYRRTKMVELFGTAS